MLLPPHFVAHSPVDGIETDSEYLTVVEAAAADTGSRGLLALCPLGVHSKVARLDLIYL